MSVSWVSPASREPTAVIFDLVENTTKHRFYHIYITKVQLKERRYFGLKLPPCFFLKHAEHPTGRASVTDPPIAHRSIGISDFCDSISVIRDAYTAKPSGY